MERLCELFGKEVVCLENGAYLGRIGELEIDEKSGCIESIVIPGRLRLFGILGREAEKVLPWEMIRRVGVDVILVRLGEKQDKKAEICELFSEKYLAKRQSV